MTCWLCGSETTQLATNAATPTCKNGPCHICVQVAKVDEEINQAVAALHRLLSKRCDLREEQNRVHETLGYRLPVEIMHHTFELLQPPRTEWGEIVHQHTWPAIPSYLTPICRRWRDIALSNPSLWNTMHVILRNISASESSRWIKFLRDWLSRSRNFPVTLHIEVREHLEEKSKDILDAISQYSNTWQSLSLSTSSDFAFDHSGLQFLRLRKLRIEGGRHDVRLLNPTASPETIQISGTRFQSLQISWNHLSSATVDGFSSQEVVQLLQHASQMTYCHILRFHDARDFSCPAIIHRRLKTLNLVPTHGAQGELLGCLTVPCLQEFHTDDPISLAYLPALAQRSSYPLTRIVISLRSVNRDDFMIFRDLQPLHGVTELALEDLSYQLERNWIKKYLLKAYCPDLRCLTLRLNPFRGLWGDGIIQMLLDRKRSRHDAPDGRLFKILVVDPDRYRFDFWTSEIGKKVREFGICLREDGFEILS